VPEGVALLDRLPVRPDGLDEFRMARLLLLLRVTERLNPKKQLDIERLGFYDFFSANPFLVIRDDEAARRKVTLAGFDARSLSYQSSGHRFTNRRARMQYDLSRLVAHGLVEVGTSAGRVTFALADNGRSQSDAYRSLYSRAYRRSAEVIVARLDKLSDRRLHEQARNWLQARPFLIDLYDFEAEDS
jgi:hypothetical protein